MESGAITGHIDVAQLTLYAFWIFFAGLILYLRGEDRREGYPLVADRPDMPQGPGLGSIPDAKTFILPHGGAVVTAPRVEAAQPTNASVPVGAWLGAPLTPLGDPMVNGAGPASYAQRADTPDLMYETEQPKIVPLRVASGYSIEPGDPDPRGMEVIAADGLVAGTVRDVWVDRADTLLRYLEVAVSVGDGLRTILLPLTLARVDGGKRQVKVSSVLARQFATAPVTRTPNQVTLREEDRITAYFASGYLYAEPSRLEPVI